MTHPTPDVTPADYLPQLPIDRSPGIGCIGSGFIMADCHLPAYRQAGFRPVISKNSEKTQKTFDISPPPGMVRFIGMLRCRSVA